MFGLATTFLQVRECGVALRNGCMMSYLRKSIPWIGWEIAWAMETRAMALRESSRRSDMILCIVADMRKGK